MPSPTLYNRNIFFKLNIERVRILKRSTLEFLHILSLLDEHGNFLCELKEISLSEPIVEIGAEVCYQAECKLGVKKGRYRLFFDLKRELVTWFHEHGCTPCVLDVEVD